MPDVIADESLVERAKAFATRFHESVGHVRKYTGEAYTEHLQAVADMVESVSGSPEMIAAAWLHDVVEDTPATLDQVQKEFGVLVAELVRELTDVSRPEDGNREARKAIDRAHLAEASVKAKTIKVADLIDNSRSVLEHDQRFAKTYMREKQLLLEVLREADEFLHREATAIVDSYFRNHLVE